MVGARNTPSSELLSVAGEKPFKNAISFSVGLLGCWLLQERPIGENKCQYEDVK